MFIELCKIVIRIKYIGFFGLILRDSLFIYRWVCFMYMCYIDMKYLFEIL